MRLALGLRIYNSKYYCIQGSRLLTANFIIIQKLIITYDNSILQDSRILAHYAADCKKVGEEHPREE
ncbi:hypothetical protein ACU8KH_05945 [Lachancea thermotolerans]